MKYLFAIVALMALAPSAHAVHVYADYRCKAGNIQLNYDGPGSNYPFGGYSNFYLNGEEKGSLSYEATEGDTETIGSEIGEFGKVEVVFSTVKNKVIKRPKVTPVDPKTCEGFDYEHSEWKSIRTIKIDAISAAASAKFGLKAGDKLVMNCDDTMDEPVRCEND